MKKIKLLFVLAFAFFSIGIAFYSFNLGYEVDYLFEKYKTPESKFIEIDGQKIHYRLTGEGEPLVLLHGVSSSLRTWDAWHDDLSKDFKVISLDLPAFGISGPFLEGDYNTEHYMSFITMFLDALQIEKCFMAGNSFGGFLTWQYAYRNPERIKKISIIDAAGMGRSELIIGFLLSRLPVVSLTSHYLTPKFLIENSVLNLYGDKNKVTDELVTSYYELLLGKGNRQAFTKVLNMLKNEARVEYSIPKLETLKIPTLIQWGDKDPVFHTDKAEDFNKYISNSKLIIYSNVGHMPMEEFPEKSANDLRMFLLGN